MLAARQDPQVTLATSISPRRPPVASRARRWLATWLSAAAVLAALLLANAVRDYLFVHRILATQQVRHQMAQYVADLEQSLRRQATPSLVPAELLGTEPATMPAHTAWIEVRRSDGAVLARRGEPGERFFTAAQESQSFRSHEPLYRIVTRNGRELVVQAFAVYAGRRPPGAPPLAGAPPPTTAPPPPQGTAPSGAPGRPFLVVELAAPLAIQDASVLRPIRWNLLVNSAGAFGLLVTVVVAALGFRTYERGRRLEEQLEIARAVQAKLLPPRLEGSDAVRTAAVYQPAEQVGGDFYDVFRTDEGSVALVVGDVSGKGVPAALLTSVIHGAVRSSAWPASPRQHELESERLNRLLWANSSGNRFASLFWCYYQASTRRLHYVNAGHCPPILVRQGEATATLAEGGPVLGLLGDARYSQAEREIHPHDVLVLYSDGLIESTNAAGEEYGETRLVDLLRSSSGSEPEAIRDAVAASVARFLGGAVPADDLTLLVARFS
jgi:hypothetical protein